MKEINFMNIGPLKTVKKSEIVGIFDIDSASATAATKRFLVNAENNKKIKSVGGDIPKSFVLMSNGDVFLSPYASRVLKSRAERNVKLTY